VRESIRHILVATMPEAESLSAADSETRDAATPARKRPKPGERRVQILQALATMLEQPGAERITTAALAGRLSVSEAALYRHFASKAQMFEGLIDFIEQTVFSLVNQIIEREPAGAAQAARVVAMLLQFGEKNPGMTRVMVGDALVFEKATLRQALREAADAGGSATPSVQAQVQASVLTAFAVGRLQRFARSGFRRLPSEQLEGSLNAMFNGWSGTRADEHKGGPER
jgi:TetR/AcrR family transcriptional regulator